MALNKMSKSEQSIWDLLMSYIDERVQDRISREMWIDELDDLHSKIEDVALEMEKYATKR